MLVKPALALSDDVAVTSLIMAANKNNQYFKMSPKKYGIPWVSDITIRNSPL